jgi:hypothetical protein
MWTRQRTASHLQPFAPARTVLRLHRHLQTNPASVGTELVGIGLVVGRFRRNSILMCLVLAAGTLSPSAASAVGTYNNARIAQIGISRIGQVGGTCKNAVNNWVSTASGGTENIGGGYYAPYLKAGGVEVGRDQSVEGDIIQLNNPSSLETFYTGMHTAVVVSHQVGSNTFTVVDSNWIAANIIGEHSYDPYARAAKYGLAVHIWRMGTAQSPAVAGYEAAFQANTGELWTVGSDMHASWGYGMASGTSPGIARLSNGGYEVAFQANTGDLWTVGSDMHANWGYGMKAGTSPSIAGLSNGGYEVVFQANTGDLWTVGSAGNRDWGYGMAGETSPSIAPLSGGGYEVAFQANTGELWTVGSNMHASWGYGMAGGTSPSIAALSGGGYEVAFQANTGELWTVGSNMHASWGYGVAGRTSPAGAPS